MPKFFLYFGLIMSSAFVAGAIFILVRPPEMEIIRDNRYIAAAILFLYGVFRLVRTMKLWKDQNNNNLR